ncbi:hypothetical protein DM02DRAFT_608773 [Periconia macrospinosa]|uniref:KANL3/Tex30 alpha/beta hydrolase-like domain-containing protein n=1 Tax=Periconia macrospinosa TaxID=97972 RepID=A0A2V1EC43_9PLEO|nr:hypothetical protein DM02DRAFT_608773 [Periconia macrospinosa]
MGPKRKILDGSADAPEAKKRVTRSSSRKTFAAQKSSPGKGKSIVAESKASKTKNDLPISKKPEGHSGDAQSHSHSHPLPSTSSTLGADPSITKLNITHDSLKTPISCDHYNAPTNLTTTTTTTKNDPTTCIFTHGAGGTISTPAVRDFCVGYAQSASILVFQGSMNLAARVKGFHACLSHIHASSQTKTSKSDTKRTSKGADERGKLVLGGRSMGSRAAVMAASEILSSSSPASSSEEASEFPDISLILVSYPLQGPKNDIRDQILFDLPASVRILFVIGDRDAMCPLDLLERTRKKMAAESKLLVVKGADHGMHVRPKDRQTEYGEETGRLAAAWVAGEMMDSVVYAGGDGEE